MTREASEIEQAVSRTLRDSLEKLQRTTEELNHAVTDLVAACASSRPSNSLSPILRAQSAAAALAASLEVLSRFVAVSLHAPPQLASAVEFAPAHTTQTAPAPDRFQQQGPQHQEPHQHPAPEHPALAEPMIASAREALEEAAPESPALQQAIAPAYVPEVAAPQEHVPQADVPEAPAPELEVPLPNPYDAYKDAYIKDAPPPVITEAALGLQPPETPDELRASDMEEEGSPAAPEPLPQLEEIEPAVQAFDVTSLSIEEQELHRRANRVAKVSMQDIKMLRPKDVMLARENKDICGRLRDDIERAHKEYERRFHAILGHPVDYFYNWMVEILGDGDSETLGEYPYPSPVLRH